MSHEAQDETPWSWPRWLGIVSGIFAFHVLALFALSGKSATPGLPPPALVTTRWITSEPAGRRWIESLLANDPTFFATVNPRGFSGAAWLNPAPITHRRTEWSDAQRWLPQATRELGGAFRQFVQTNATPAIDIAEWPAPPAPAVRVTQQAARLHSQLSVTGPLAARPLSDPPRLPSWPHPDLLKDTTVQLLVNANGRVLSTRLLDTAPVQDTVQKQADQHALELARALRFQTLKTSTAARSPAAPYTEGILIFQWHTTAPAAAKP